MQAGNLLQLCQSIAAILFDYRQGEIDEPTAAHVQRWIEQFDAAFRLAMLEELDHVLRKTYVSRDQMQGFLGSLVENEKLTGADPAAFWSRVELLELQGVGKSQREMVAYLRGRIHGAWALEETGRAPSVFMYLDDGIFTGATLIRELGAWITSLAPRRAHVHVVVAASHSGGSHYAQRTLSKRARDAKKDVDITVWRLRGYEDRNAFTDTADVLRPVVIVAGDAAVDGYVRRLDAWGHPPRFRSSRSDVHAPFRSAAGREILERELLRAGCHILARAPNASRIIRPLGVSGLDTLGFGTLALTFRNCPNNAPIALWWGGEPGHPALDWYPLVPRYRATDVAGAPAVARVRIESEPDPTDDPGFFWESEAQEAVDRALEELVFDEEERMASIAHECGETTFDDLEDLVQFLGDLYDEGWYANAPRDDGEPWCHRDGLTYAREELCTRFGEKLKAMRWQ